MGFGSNVSADVAGGQPGMDPNDPAVLDTRANTYDQFAAAQGGGSGGGPSLADLLKDPKVIQALGSAVQGLGKITETFHKLPPQSSQLLQHAMQMQQQRQRQAQAPPQYPYRGDAASFLTPEIAQLALQQMGIPT